MSDGESKAYSALIGDWRGNGEGPQGPFDVRATFEERGRWVLLRHEIAPPGSAAPFYVSTQVFGFDDGGLTLDYFDTAGSFHFDGERTDTGLAFAWKAGDQAQAGALWKKSSYEFEADGALRFQYQSCEQSDGEAAALLEFSGLMNRA